MITMLDHNNTPEDVQRRKFLHALVVTINYLDQEGSECTAEVRARHLRAVSDTADRLWLLELRRSIAEQPPA